MTNVALTAENRPAWIPLGSVFGDEGENGTTHEDKGRIEIFVVFLRVASVKLLGFLLVDSKEVGA